MIPLLLMFHILGIALWAGALLSVAVVLVQHARESGATSGALAQTEKRLLRGMADPGAAVTLLAGIGLAWMNPSYYLHARWFYVKLALVLLLAVLHGWAGLRVKRLAAGHIQLSAGDAWQMFLLVALNILLIAGFTMFGRLYLP